MNGIIAQEGPASRGMCRLHWRRLGMLALAAVALLSPSCSWNELFAWNGGKFTFLGYSTKPNYDPRFKKVRIKMFKNNTFWAVVPVPGLEQELTRALVREIQANTPYMVVQGDADVEIVGAIRSFNKAILNYTQLNEQREVETTLTVEVLWRDLRTGEILSSPAPRALEPPPPNGLPPGAQDPLLLPPGMSNQPGVPLVASPASPLSDPSPAGGLTPQPPPQPPSMGGAPLPPATPSQPGIPGSPPGAPGTPGGNGPSLGGVMVRSVAHFRPELGESLSSAEQKNIDRMATQIISMMEVGW